MENTPLGIPSYTMRLIPVRFGKSGGWINNEEMLNIN